MADTTGLEVATDWIRVELQRRFGTAFTKREIRLRQGGRRTFNAVSADESIVAQVSHSSGPTSGGKKPTGKIHGAISSLYFLAQSRSSRRILVLTDRRFHDFVAAEVDGALTEGLELLHVELPPELVARVRAVTSNASDEMS
jgi:hypothetical protein